MSWVSQGQVWEGFVECDLSYGTRQVGRPRLKEGRHVLGGKLESGFGLRDANWEEVEVARQVSDGFLQAKLTVEFAMFCKVVVILD
jgi:hypothetical protein